jgi:predicted HicB family RNase H-like nuclease
MSKFARLLKEVKEKEGEASGERLRGKSRREDYVAMKVYISKELHRRLKLKALEEEKELSELVEEALRKFLVTQSVQ